MTSSIERMQLTVVVDTVFDELAITSIRRATRGRHAALESVAQLVPALNQLRYILALRAFDLFLSAWEPRIDAALPLPLRHWFVCRSRRDLLRRDLDQLDDGRVVHEQIRWACDRAVSEIELSSAASAFGSIYVLEGSALGGQVIARVARTMLGLDADNGAAYFNGRDRHTAVHWKAFQVLLEEQVGVEPTARQEACAAARHTFDALITTFTALHDDRIAA
jgi:heme oxygenase